MPSNKTGQATKTCAPQTMKQSFLKIYTTERKFPKVVFSDLEICLHVHERLNRMEQATFEKNTHVCEQSLSL